MINKINPLYVLALFITLVIISFSQIQSSKKELSKNINEFNQFKEDVLQYKSLKKTWKDKDYKKILSSIRRLNPSIEYKEYKRKVVLTLNSTDNSLKQRFINKVLNNSLKIEKFDIKENIILFEIGKNK